MDDYLLDDVGDDVLSRELPEYTNKECHATVDQLIRVAAYDARKLYVPAGFPSMHAYCVQALHLSEDEAYRRIQVARVARRYPALFEALDHNRLHMTAVRLLAPHLTPANAEELIGAAVHQTSSAIERFLADRFPGPELLVNPGFTRPVQPAPVQVARTQLAPRRVEAVRVLPDTKAVTRVTPVSAETYDLHARIPKSAHDNLRYAQDLLGHALPSGDVGQVLDRALKLLVSHLERQKFGATERPRASRRTVMRRRDVPARVQRAVWDRDGGQCTFVGTSGRRCPARKRLEFDHIAPVARGGRSTVENLRLRCHAHNQFEAEQTFGTEFMNDKRERARLEQETREREKDIVAGMRGLGVQADLARRAAQHALSLHLPTIEEQFKAACKFIRPKTMRISMASP